MTIHPYWITAGLLGIVFAALKLASLFGGNVRAIADHDRRIDKLEKTAEGVPEEIEAEVSAQTMAVDSAEQLLRANVARMARELRHAKVVLGAIEQRCTVEHGPISKVVSLDDMIEPEDLDEPKGKP